MPAKRKTAKKQLPQIPVIRSLSRKMLQRSTYVLMFMFVGTALLIFTSAATPANTYNPADEAEFFNLTNNYRKARGIGSLTAATCLLNRARSWSKTMAAQNNMHHSSTLGSDITSACNVANKWSFIAENVGWCSINTSDCSKVLFDMMVGETPPNDGHRRNILSTGSYYQAVGVYYDYSGSGKIWLTQDFLSCNGSCGVATYNPNASVAPTWHGWHKVSSSSGQTFPLSSAPAVSTWGSGRYDIFQCNNGSVQHLYYQTGASWKGWENLGGTCVGDLTATSSEANRVDVFALTSGGTIRRNYWNGSAWSGWAAVPGGPFKGSISANSQAANTLELYATNSNNQVLHSHFGNGAWGAWETLNGTIGKYGISAIARPSAPNTQIVYGVGTAGDLISEGHAASWANWQSLGGVLTSTPAADAYGNLAIVAIARGTDNQLHQKWYSNGPGWTGWSGLPMPGVTAASAPGIGDWSSTHIDLYVKASDGYLWQNSWY